VQHISEILGNVDSDADKFKLWNNLNDPNFSKVSFNGVHGHIWSPPLAGTGNGGFKISSPHSSSSKKVSRVIANVLGSGTKSGSSFDLPSRKNVLQIDIPSSTIKTTTYSYNASTETPPNTKVKKFGVSKENHRFLQNDRLTPKVKSSIEGTLNQAQNIEQTATKLLGQISSSPTNMVIPIHTKNKKEKNDLTLPLK